MVLAPLNSLSNRRICIGKHTLMTGQGSLRYERIASIRVEVAGNGHVLIVNSRKGTSTYGISPEIDIGRIEAFLNEHARPEFREQPPRPSHDIPPRKLALFIGGSRALGC
jgi:hypothetical protein